MNVMCQAFNFYPQSEAIYSDQHFYVVISARLSDI